MYFGEPAARRLTLKISNVHMLPFSPNCNAYMDDGKIIILPFSAGDLAPTPEELEWEIDTLKKYCDMPQAVLEFGCGITTWAATFGIRTFARRKVFFAADHGVDYYAYLAIETHAPLIEAVRQHAPIVKIESTWENLGIFAPYNLVIIDSSAGCGRDGEHRDEALRAAEPHMMVNAMVLIHDWRRRSGRKVRAYLESERYKLLESYKGRTGWGLYRRQMRFTP